MKTQPNYALFFILCCCIFVFTIFVGCGDEVQSPIPDYPVYLELPLTAQYPTFKNSLGAFLSTDSGIVVSGNDKTGFAGIVVCTGITLDTYGNTQYYAFDMACPYEIKNTVKVAPDAGGLPQLVCKQCGSIFDVGFGTGNPISGPADKLLKKYKTIFSGDVLYVTP